MTHDEETRRGRSARHYLVDETLARRLRPTVSLAAIALGFPTAMVNIIDQDTQHTITMLGLDGLLTTPREEALCNEVVRTGQPLIVPRASEDPRFAHYPAVVSGDLCTYVGVPLIGRESFPIGVLCVMDSAERTIDGPHLARLQAFAEIVDDQLDLLRRLNEQRGEGSVATAELARAIRTREIVPWYQPIIDLASGRTVGFEALARWVHPTGAVDDPNGFIPLAEDSDLIIDLDLSVIRQAFDQLNRWQVVDPTLRMGVNLSSRHFDQPDWLDAIVDAAAEAEVAPESVYLELTETERLSRGESDGVFVRQLQARGFRVLLDDFGTGWASLEYLLRLPVDGIKIDRVMSVALGTPVGDALIRAVVGLTAELGLTNTIEGIETPEQATLAAGMGCTLGQGYLWSAPRPPETILISPPPGVSTPVVSRELSPRELPPRESPPRRPGPPGVGAPRAW